MKKISECPQNLSELIEIINLLPKDIPDFMEKKRLLYQEFSDEGNQVYARITSAQSLSTDSVVLSDILSLQAKYRDKLGQLLSTGLIKKLKYVIAPFSFQNASFKLNVLINENLTLLNIIESFRCWDIDYNRQIDHRPDFNLDKPLVAYSFNDDTSLQFTSFRILEILTANKIPIERIRICPICDEVFWAKRIEAKTCSKRRCSNNFHQRKLRIKEYEERLNNEVKKLEKLQSSLSSGNGLISQQKAKVDKISEKIKSEKMKNGTL